MAEKSVHEEVSEITGIWIPTPSPNSKWQDFAWKTNRSWWQKSSQVTRWLQSAGHHAPQQRVHNHNDSPSKEILSLLDWQHPYLQDHVTLQTNRNANIFSFQLWARREHSNVAIPQAAKNMMKNLGKEMIFLLRQKPENKDASTVTLRMYCCQSCRA